MSPESLARLHRAGAPVTLSTDDRTVSDLTLPTEYANTLEHIGLSLAELVEIDRHAFEGACLHDDEPVRARLLAAFDGFVASEPLLEGTVTDAAANG